MRFSPLFRFRIFALAAALLVLLPACAGGVPADEPFNNAMLAMDTMITQTAYGPNAAEAMQQFNTELAALEARLSMYLPGSDIARINAAAGLGGADVSPETADLLRQGLALSAASEGAFAFTIAPITMAWGIISENPRVVPQAEIDALLPLVNDSLVSINGSHVTLPLAGMGLDLGAFAKGAACSLARDIYTRFGVKSAFVSLGGSSIYVHGTKPDGTPFRIGFRDPAQSETASIASFTMQDEAIGVSGGYERYFVGEDGEAYIHIMDARTGRPAETDILSVGVICPDGAEADFYSTSLFILGKERCLQFMRSGGKALLLDKENNLYVSESLRGSFSLNEGLEDTYTVVFVAEE